MTITENIKEFCVPRLLRSRPNNPFYFPEIDGLRAFSISMVLIFHIYPTVLIGGYIGVDVFFVISGFLITSILLREYEKSGTISLIAFFKRRVLRIWPALFVLLSVYVAAAVIFSSVWHDHVVAAVATGLGLMNWLRALTSLPQGFLGHMWSLSLEEQFYFLWPTTLLGILRFGRRVTLSIIVIVIFSVVTWRCYLSLHDISVWRTYNSLDTRVDTILVGCAIALLPKNVAPRVLTQLWPIPIIFLTSVALLVNWATPWMHRVGFTLVALSAGWIILLITRSEKVTPLRRILSMRPVVLIGIISYSLYLWHFPIISILRSYGLANVYVVIFSPVLSFLAASLSYLLIERPFLILKAQGHKVLQYADIVTDA